MAENEIQVQEVHLAATNAKIGDEPVVVVTLRPDLPSYRPIPRSQAERLLEDLKTLLSRSTAFLMLLALALAGSSGCSGKVEVETETSSRPEADVLTTEKTRTAVSVDLLRERGSVVAEDGRALEVPLDGVVVVEGCIHFHETLVICLDEGDKKAERVALEVVREWNK